MQSAQSLFSAYKLPTKKARGMGPRQELISRVAYELGIPKQYLSGLFFQTQILTDQEIIDIKDASLSFRANPGALFRKKIKEKRAQIKLQLENVQPTTEN